MIDESILSELREVFREELEDHAATLERAAVMLAKGTSTTEELRAAGIDVFRAVHSLKGAARAVGYAAIETLCHDRETRWASLREAPPTAPTALAGEVNELLVALRQLAAPPETMVAREVAEPSLASVESEDVPPRAPNPAPMVPVVETVRVSVDRVADVIAATEELLAACSASSRLLDGFSNLDDEIAQAAQGVRRARQALRARDAGAMSDEPASAAVLADLDRALSSIEHLATWSSEQRARAEVTWRAVRGSAAEVHERSRGMRLVPLSTLLPALERTAFELARSLDREVTLVWTGEHVEIDRRVRDALREPLLHLIRNAIDHGIESPEERRRAGKPRLGRLSLDAAVAGGDVKVELHDDGRGIDVEALRGGDREVSEEAVLARLFEPGVTTRAEASEISGRGMGLDIVRQRVSELRGRVQVKTSLGHGTTFAITVPLDLSVVPGLVVRVRDVSVVLVLTTVDRLLRATEADLVTIEGRLYLRDPRSPIPLADLDAILGFGGRSAIREAPAPWPTVVLSGGGQRAAVRVDRFSFQGELVVHPLGARVVRAAFVSGAASLEGAELALVLDSEAVVGAARPADATSSEAPKIEARKRILVVDDSVTTRQLERAILEAAGYDVTVAADGREAWELLRGEESFDAVVSDIEMPEMDGFSLLARLRDTQRLHTLPFVLVTALDQPHYRQRAVELGASAYVVKSSFDQESLLSTLEQLT